MSEVKVGEVIHFFDKLSVAIVKLSGTLKVGDRVKFKHADQEFDQEVTSMEREHQSIDSAKDGDEVGVKVSEPVKEKTQVLLVS